jgi:UPF0755 protein
MRPAGWIARHRARVLVAAAFVLLVAAAGVILAVSLGRTEKPTASTTSSTGAVRKVVIPDGASAQRMAEILQQEGIIKEPGTFLEAVQARAAATSLKPGTYEFSPGQDYGSIIAKLESGETSPDLKLTIPEGLAIDQTAERLEEQGRLDGALYAKLARSPKDFTVPPVGGTVPKITTLEGLLFPSTYELDESAASADLISQQLKTFSDMTEGLPWARTKDLSVTPYQVVIVASLVEKEASVAEERPLVAAVIYNRLAQKMALGIDATTRFGLKKWTGPLTQSDLETDSPYNTRSRKGLPPGPIASPGVAALEAALSPAKVDYLYYVLIDEEGHHFFTASYQEFLKAKERTPTP